MNANFTGNRMTEEDWRKFHALTDAQIEAAIADDPDAWTPGAEDKEFWDSKNWTVVLPKETVAIEVDKDLVGWLRAHKAEYTVLFNDTLRRCLTESHRPEAH